MLSHQYSDPWLNLTAATDKLHGVTGMGNNTSDHNISAHLFINLVIDSR